MSKERLTVTVDPQLVRAGGDAVAAYEKEFGPITAAEIAAQERADRAAARVCLPPAR